MPSPFLLILPPILAIFNPPPGQFAIYLWKSESYASSIACPLGLLPTSFHTFPSPLWHPVPSLTSSPPSSSCASFFPLFGSLSPPAPGVEFIDTNKPRLRLLVWKINWQLGRKDLQHLLVPWPWDTELATYDASCCKIAKFLFAFIILNVTSGSILNLLMI